MSMETVIRILQGCREIARQGAAIQGLYGNRMLVEVIGFRYDGVTVEAEIRNPQGKTAFVPADTLAITGPDQRRALAMHRTPETIRVRQSTDHRLNWGVAR